MCSRRKSVLSHTVTHFSYLPSRHLPLRTSAGTQKYFPFSAATHASTLTHSTASDSVSNSIDFSSLSQSFESLLLSAITEPLHSLRFQPETHSRAHSRPMNGPSRVPRQPSRTGYPRPVKDTSHHARIQHRHLHTNAQETPFDTLEPPHSKSVHTVSSAKTTPGFVHIS